ncbi:MAG: hypothetical protein HY660_12460 [Armatimonadetes bacterium]|nr:hypothetical protein [Armatimonadota bacterium]
MRILTASHVRQALPMRDAIAAVREGAMELSRGTALVPQRVSVPVEAHEAVALYMPAFLRANSWLGVKAVSVYPHNPDRGLPVITAAVLLQDAASGRPLGLLEGAALTALRTGAIGGLAADLLARRDAKVIALFGAGVQGRSQLEAACTVRPPDEVRVMDLKPGRATVFVQEIVGAPFLRGARLRPVDRSEEAADGADLIITSTTSPRPVFDGARVKAGAHVTAIGAFTPEAREVDSTLVQRARVFVDGRQACLAEAGDLLIPMKEGRITEAHIIGEIGEVAAGAVPGRTAADEITLFKSVGNAAFDVSVGTAVLRAAERQRLGEVVDLEA